MRKLCIIINESRGSKRTSRPVGIYRSKLRRDVIFTCNRSACLNCYEIENMLPEVIDKIENGYEIADML